MAFILFILAFAMAFRILWTIIDDDDIDSGE